MGGSSNKSSGSSTSRPLTGVERQDIFQHGLGNIFGTLTGQSYSPAPAGTPSTGKVRQPTAVAGAATPAPSVSFPQFESSNLALPEYQAMQGGDYNRLESAVREGYLAPLKRFESVQREGVNQDAADRGIWSSGLAMQAQNDLTEALAPQYVAAGSAATQARYDLESQERDRLYQSATNKYGLDMQERDDRFNANWAPLNYLQGLWNETGGSVSNQTNKSRGWGLNIS